MPEDDAQASPVFSARAARLEDERAAAAEYNEYLDFLAAQVPDPQPEDLPDPRP